MYILYRAYRAVLNGLGKRCTFKSSLQVLGEKTVKLKFILERNYERF